MFQSLHNALFYLGATKYLIIFVLAVIEGPVLTMLCGFLVLLGEVNPFIAFVFILLGDLVGDSLYYLLGKWSRARKSLKLMRFLGITRARLQLIEQHFKKKPIKIMALGKAAHGIGPVALIAAGLAHFPYGEFLLVNLVLTAIKSFVLMLVGYYSGHAYSQVSSALDWVAFAAITAFLIMYFVFLYFTKTSLRHEHLDRNG